MEREELQKVFIFYIKNVIPLIRCVGAYISIDFFLSSLTSNGFHSLAIFLKKSFNEIH